MAESSLSHALTSANRRRLQGYITNLLPATAIYAMRTDQDATASPVVQAHPPDADQRAGSRQSSARTRDAPSQRRSPTSRAADKPDWDHHRMMGPRSAQSPVGSQRLCSHHPPM